MRTLLSRLWRDECGFVVSSEVAVVGGLAILGVTTGVAALRTSTTDELDKPLRLDEPLRYEEPVQYDESPAQSKPRPCGARW